MSEVNVTINARQYRMACETGQEQHLLELSKDLDQRIAQLRTSFGEVGDTRLTVMAALTVADELAEAGRTIRRLEEELAALKDARDGIGPHPGDADCPGQRVQRRGRPHRRPDQKAQPDHHRRRRDGVTALAPRAGRGKKLSTASLAPDAPTHYISQAGLRGALG
jgi:cell division protein ZapA (FtsZ GTPase activity inhibitor)